MLIKWAIHFSYLFRNSQKPFKPLLFYYILHLQDPILSVRYLQCPYFSLDAIKDNRLFLLSTDAWISCDWHVMKISSIFLRQKLFANCFLSISRLSKSPWKKPCIASNKIWDAHFISSLKWCGVLLTSKHHLLENLILKASCKTTASYKIIR